MSNCSEVSSDTLHNTMGIQLHLRHVSQSSEVSSDAIYNHTLPRSIWDMATLLSGPLWYITYTTYREKQHISQ